MGQRQQIFIRIENPTKKEEFLENVFPYGKNEKDVRLLKAVFGEKDTTILPFHHQWLYGLTSVAMLSKILNIIKNASGEFNPFSKDFIKPQYDPKGNGLIKGFIETVTHLINFQDSQKVAELTGRYGLESFYFLTLDSFDEDYNREKDMCNPAEDCSCVDNNDGIIIIDAITNKYAYVNLGFGDSTILTLPELRPITALDYVKAYYEDEKEIFDLTKELTDNFDVLTIEELKEIFPKNF